MKILVLDDERWRHEEYDRALPGHEIHHVYSYAQFRSALRKFKDWDVVSFDYDIETNASKTGADAATLFCAERNMKPGTLCVVHSWNKDGAGHVCRILADAGRKVTRYPFGHTLLEQVLPALGVVPIRDSRAWVER